jgi:hypothetical protein
LVRSVALSRSCFRGVNVRRLTSCAMFQPPPVPSLFDPAGRRNDEEQGWQEIAYDEEEGEEDKGWEPMAGVQDCDARGPDYLEPVNMQVRFKPTRNSVVRLGPLKSMNDNGGGELCEDQDEREIGWEGWDGARAGPGPENGCRICQVYDSDDERTWELVARTVQQDGTVVEEELRNP